MDRSDTASDEDGTPLEKVLVEYLDGDAPRTERLWAKPVGGGLYEIRNSPWFAYRINWGDIVRAVEVARDEVPRVIEVVERSGHRTLRVLFQGELQDDPRGQDAIIEAINRYNTTVERFNRLLVALDAEPEADYEALFAYLAERTTDGSLIFEQAWVEDGTTGFGSNGKND